MHQSSDGSSFADDGTREPDADTQAVFEALADPDCRMIVGTAVDPMTANELAEACEIPLSTTYRKIDRLTATPLLEERTRLDPSAVRSTAATGVARRIWPRRLLARRST